MLRGSGRTPSPPMGCPPLWCGGGCPPPVGVGVVGGQVLVLKVEFSKFHTNVKPKALGIFLKF